MRTVIIVLLILAASLHLNAGVVAQEKGLDFESLKDPYEDLTTTIRNDWTRALEYIQKNDRQGFKECIMHPEASLVFFDGMFEALTHLPNAIQKLAVIGYTYPESDTGTIRDAFVSAGPFQVESKTKITYTDLEGNSIEFAIKPGEDYYLYVQLTNEKESDEEKVPNPAEYRFQSPLLPRTFEECVAAVVPRKAQLNLGDKDYHMQTFSKTGDAIKGVILKAWSQK